MKLHIARSATIIAVSGLTLVTALAVAPSASAATVTSVRTLSSATLNPGQSRTVTWTNANSDIYQINVGAVRANNSDVSCLTEVTKQSYRLTAGGSRQFLFTYKNVDSVACRTTPYMAIIDADRSGSTGTINAGSSKSWHWNNANVNDFVYFAAANPSEPESGRCDLQVSWKNRTRPDGEREFVWTVRNNGTVACSGQWRLGWLPVDQRTLFPADDPPGPPGHLGSLSTPVTDSFRVYFFNLLVEPASSGNCEWGPRFLQMRGDPSVPTADARTNVGYTNVGSAACVHRGVTMAFID